MPKRCPECQTLNISTALTCSNPACLHQFSPDSSRKGAAQPAVAAVGAPQPVIPAVAAPHTVNGLAFEPAQRDHEFAEMRALVGRLEKELGDRLEELERTRARIDTARVDTATPPRATTSGDAATPAWMATALRTVARWPKVASIVTAVTAVGAGYGGMTGLSSFFSPASPPAVGASVDPAPGALKAATPASDPGPIQAGVGGTNTGPVKPEDRSSTLDKPDQKQSQRESELKTREERLQALTQELAAKDKSLIARAASLEEQRKAIASAAAGAGARMGQFDFVLPSDADVITLTRDFVQGSWPSGNCVVTAVVPLDRDDIPSSFGTVCSTDRIVLQRPRGVPSKKRVRVIWQLTK